jgi:hypothetical protein
MDPPRLLIRCAAPRSEDREDIERWLASRVRGLAGGRALIYHFAPPRGDAAADGRGDAWIVEFGAAGETAPPGTIPVLLADMRLLGLDPAVFEPVADSASSTARPGHA